MIVSKWLFHHLGFDLTLFSLSSPSLGLSKIHFYLLARLMSIRNTVVCWRTTSSLSPSALASDSADCHQRLVMNNLRKLRWRSACKVWKVTFPKLTFISELFRDSEQQLGVSLVWRALGYKWLSCSFKLAIHLQGMTRHSITPKLPTIYEEKLIFRI